MPHIYIGNIHDLRARRERLLGHPIPDEDVGGAGEEDAAAAEGKAGPPVPAGGRWRVQVDHSLSPEIKEIATGNRVLTGIGIGILGLLVGGALGYLLANSRAEAKRRKRKKGKKSRKKARSRES
jgi:hypothetical protein